MGDVWAFNLSPLELQNAETKRVARTGASQHQQLKTAGEQRVRKPGGVGHTIVKTKGYSTTMALSTLRKLLGSQYLRRGDGIVSTVNTRRAERLFGLKGSGHVKKGLVGAVKLEKLRGDGFRIQPCR